MHAVRAVVAAAGLMVAGCAGSAPGAGTPVPASAVQASAVQASAVPASAVPASAVARLTAIASRAAKANGDPHPSWATAVLTTHAKALTSATPGDFVPGSGGVPVFLVTMRGRFVAYDASVPPGAAAPTGTYLSLVVDAKTFQALDFGLSPKPPPVSPASLGPVTYLIGHPVGQAEARSSTMSRS
jgi:hypothetical protein